MVAPKPGFRFHYRWFGTYGTYLLEPQPAVGRRAIIDRNRLEPLQRQTHPAALMLEQESVNQAKNRVLLG